MSEQNIKEKTIYGLGWNGANQLLQAILGFVVTVILIRLIPPDEFGKIGMIVVFSGFAIIFTELGLNSALIQKKDLSAEQISTVFWATMLLALLIAILFFCLAPLIASFYGIPQLKWLARAISVHFIFVALSGTHRALLLKAVNFKSIFKINALATLISGTTAITLAYFNFGVWSLLGQILSHALITAFLMWTQNTWRPTFTFQWSLLKPLLAFSLPLSGNTTLNYWARNFDNLIIGRMLGDGALGIYTKAYSLLLFPLKNITYIFNQVLFPSFSTIQSDHRQIAQIYTQSLSMIALLTFPLMAGLFVVSEHFVHAFFGTAWLEMIPLIKIFSILGMLQSIMATTGTLFFSQNRTDLVFKFSLVTKLVLFISLFLCVPYGLEAVAYCLLANTLIFGFLQMYLAVGLIQLSLLRVLKALLPILLVTLLSGGVAYGINKSLAETFNPIVTMFMVLLSGFTIYVGALRLFRIHAFQMALNFFNKRRKNA